MKINETKDLKTYIYLYGHNMDNDIYELDDDMLKYVQRVNEMYTDEVKNYSVKLLTKKELVKKSKIFIESILKFHKIRCMTDLRLQSIVMNEDITNIGELVQLYNLGHDMISPFSLPLEFKDKNILSGMLNTQVLYIENKQLFYDVLKLLNICFSKIELSYYKSELSVSCLIHELTHTQLASEKGLVDDLYNTEVLSIFLELLHSYSSNHNNYLLLLENRLKLLTLSFHNMYVDERDDLVDDDIFNYCMNGKYLISIIKAFNLFDKYINSDSKVKKDILRIIQGCIDGNYIFETALDKLDISYESSLDSKIVRRLILK